MKQQPEKPPVDKSAAETVTINGNGTTPRRGLQEIIRFWMEGVPGSDIVYADPNDAIHEELISDLHSRQVIRRTRYPHARTFLSGDDREMMCVIDTYVGIPSVVDTGIYLPEHLHRSTLIYRSYEPVVIWILDHGVTVKVIAYNPISHWFQPIYPRNGEYRELEGLERLEDASTSSCSIF